MKILLKGLKEKEWKMVKASSYKAEDELQELIAEYPDLIPTDEIGDGTSPFEVAVREIGLPGSGYTDLLLLNASGDVALIECKLASNSEIKRKVIGQILEYGAYLWGMSYDELDQRVTRISGKSIPDLVQAASGISEGEWDPDALRVSIQERLAKGDFILIVLVDEFNDELKRTVEFLNTCGNPNFSSHALEIPRFSSEEQEILVPHLFGTQAKQPGTPSKRKKWDENMFFDELVEDKRVHEIARDLYEWSTDKADRIFWGTGANTGTYTFHLLIDGKTSSIFTVHTDGDITLNFGYLANQVEAGDLQWLIDQLLTLGTFKRVEEGIKWPIFDLKEVFPEGNDIIDGFKSIVEEFSGRVK